MSNTEAGTGMPGSAWRRETPSSPTNPPRNTAGTQMLDEALSRLNEASRERRGEVQKLLDEKYTDLKLAFGDVAHASTDWAKEKGMEVGAKARLAARTVNRSVRMHPWYYVGGAAASGLVVGLLMRRRPRPASV